MRSALTRFRTSIWTLAAEDDLDLLRDLLVLELEALELLRVSRVTPSVVNLDPRLTISLPSRSLTSSAATRPERRSRIFLSASSRMIRISSLEFFSILAI